MDEAARKIITVGSIKMTLPSFMTLMAGVVLSIVMALRSKWLYSIVLLISFSLTSYTINCTVVGHCTSWAWVLAIFNTLNVVFILFLVAMKMFAQARTGRK